MFESLVQPGLYRRCCPIRNRSWIPLQALFSLPADPVLGGGKRNATPSDVDAVLCGASGHYQMFCRHCPLHNFGTAWRCDLLDGCAFDRTCAFKGRAHRPLWVTPNPTQKLGATGVRSNAGSSSSRHQRRRCMGGTWFMTMEPSSFGIHAKLICAGKTPRVLPMVPMPANVHLDCTGNHWQSCATLQGYVEHLDGLLSWCLTRPAPVSPRLSGRRCTLPSLCHIKCACVPAKATSFSQPLDVSVMKAFKRAMARHTNQHFAMAILDACNDEGETALDHSMMTLKTVLPLWVSQAITELGAYESAWRPLQWGTPAQFLQVVAAPLGGHILPHKRQTAGDARATARRG